MKARDILEKVWLEHHGCHDCPYHYTEYKSGFLKDHFCTASPRECPGIFEMIEVEVETSFDPDEIVWLTKYNLDDPEGLSLVKFAHEFNYNFHQAYDQAVLWKTYQAIKKELS